MNDKGINDALENGITSCLRSLQRTNPSLLLTAHQLKRVERDVKYVPAVAGAIASVMCRSKQLGLYEHAMNVMSSWDEEVKSLGIAPFDQSIEPSQRASTSAAQQATNPHASSHEREMCQIEMLCPLLERRLRFVVSEEFKDAKREKARQEREDEAAERRNEKTMQKRKQKRATKADEMNSDCFDSDDSIAEHVASRPLDNAKTVQSDFGSVMSSPEKNKSREREFYDSDASDEASHSLDRKEKRSAAAIPAVIHSPTHFACHDGLDTDEEESRATANNVFKTDGMSSDDDWDERFGMVVPGSFFR